MNGSIFTDKECNVTEDGFCYIFRYKGTEAEGHYWHDLLYFCIYCGQLWVPESINWKKVNPGLTVKGIFKERA